jgi:hypothetical protein
MHLLMVNCCATSLLTSFSLILTNMSITPTNASPLLLGLILGLLLRFVGLFVEGPAPLVVVLSIFC